ncbi:E3 ubiquitin-protein ligase RNF167 isoform X2 [Plodia interpunctella]|uniref:E3 ubiquitin-protein ligase RNF167 isoform X2 n=1 Tax=Plodia interpunctella TaxID=58824 RepID=UPI002367744A|nr:E3 ubiquitin-protein ligase RNF167 isoform X2 [Plodia interpunctella]
MNPHYAIKVFYVYSMQHLIAEEFLDMPASFGGVIPVDGLRGLVVPGEPEDGCGNMTAPPAYDNFTGKWIALVARFGCNFETKVRNAQAAGYHCAIVHNVNSSEIETMSAKDPEGITIPSVFVSDSAGFMLMDLYNYTSGYYVMVNDDIPFNINTHLLLPFAVVVVLCLVIILISMVVKCVRERRRARRQRLPNKFLRQIPTCEFSKAVPYDTCAICLDDYLDGDTLRVLPCAHAYHASCVDPWLTQNRRVCPVCKRRVFVAKERRHTDSDSDDTAPLMGDDDSVTTNSGTFSAQRENPFVRAARRVRALRRRESQAPAEETAPEEEAEPTEEPQEDVTTTSETQSLLPTAAAVSERPPRRGRRPRSARTTPTPARTTPTPTRTTPTPTRSTPSGTQAVPALPRSDGVSINTDNGEGEIGVAALPAPPLASSTPHHLNL